MKNIFLILGTLLVFVSVDAQIAIEKGTVNSSAILDFPALVGSEGNGGINLPRNSNTNEAGTISGTFLVDASTQTVKYYGDGEWVDLTSAKSGEITTYVNLKEANGEGVRISDHTYTETESLTGAVSLSSKNRALQLPVVADVTQLPEPPTAGMICYDKASQSLAVFNGEKWAFWN